MAKLLYGKVPVRGDELPKYLAEVIPLIAAALGQSSVPVLGAAPSKVYDGLMVLANGTTWDPGSGQGVYAYYGSAWHKL